MSGNHQSPFVCGGERRPGGGNCRAGATFDAGSAKSRGITGFVGLDRKGARATERGETAAAPDRPAPSRVGGAVTGGEKWRMLVALRAIC